MFGADIGLKGVVVGLNGNDCGCQEDIRGNGVITWDEDGVEGVGVDDRELVFAMASGQLFTRPDGLLRIVG